MPDRRTADRHLYLWGGIAAALIVFAGFARTFYLRGLFESPALSGLLVLHGTIMTLWLALFILQVSLVGAGRTDLHRRLGVSGAVLFALVLGVGFATAIAGARRGASPAPEVPPLAFMAIPMVDLVVFALLVGTALWKRRKPATHKRLMLLGTLAILAPGIARIPVGFIQKGGLPVVFGLTIVAVLVAVAVDTVRQRRLHPACGWGGALVVVSVPLRVMLAGSPVWLRFATWLVG
jgi:hypothetical protein